MHSHSGLDTWPYTDGSSDTNEMAETPLHPELRSIDGFDPSDLSISIINSGGVTTSLILPGSGNMMGGEAFAIKHRYFPSNRTEDMLLNSGLPREEGSSWRWMKMACGENPIRSYGVSHWVSPESRLGEAYLFRKRISAAREVMREQDQWCWRQSHNEPLYKRYPDPIEHESLIALLRGKVLLNVHCYETYDLEMMVKLSHEFNFTINTFHHALEAWRVADMLREENIAVAIFVLIINKADHWGYKKEAYDASTKAAKLLTEKGVKVAFKSDHPVLNAQNLIFEAAKGHHYGLSPELAIKSVTSIPAERMGQDNRIGYARVGYDADVVIWDKNPLEIGAHPLRVFVDGYSTFQHDDYESSIQVPYEMSGWATEKVEQSELVIPESLKDTVVTYTNITGLIHSANAVQDFGSKIVVENNIITCLGPTCATKGAEINLQAGWVIPGIIAAGVHLGLGEISSESVTSSGRLESNAGSEYLQSSAGLRLGRTNSRLLDCAFKAGVTTAISSLRFTGSSGAHPTAFRVGSTQLNHDSYIKESLPVEFRVGDDAKRSGVDSTIPGQISQIRRPVFGTKTIRTNGANHIYSVSSKLLDLNFIILGGKEAHKIPYVFGAGRSVILSPARCVPSDWTSQDCLVTSKTPTAIDILQNAGVNVGVTVNEDNMIRGLIWEAGWKIADSVDYKKLGEFEFAKRAAALVTWNIASAYGISDLVGEIRVGQAPNFVVYDGVPGTLSAHVKLVVDGDLIETNTVPY